ncbi:MAG: sporulation protein [Oscillospiraceae bacterium]|jgi:sporulation protein YabP|nr:sporulation protein [Oscillospiraceae bacterium]
MRDERIVTADMPHHVIMEGRGKLSVTGVLDVESFDETSVICASTCGVLVIRGRELHVGRLNIDGGELCVEGTIDTLEYEDTAPRQGGFFSRIFG